MLTARESREVQECRLGSAQSAGMQEGAGKRRRVQASHWKLQKPGFHQPGREQAYQRCCIVITFRPWGLGPLLLLSLPPWGLGGVIADITLRTQGWHCCRHLEVAPLPSPP